jgi:hypothetical protein
MHILWIIIIAGLIAKLIHPPNEPSAKEPAVCRNCSQPLLADSVEKGGCCDAVR